MIPIAQLKDDLEFYRSLGSLIEVLKLIAAAQYQTLEKKFSTFETYLNGVEKFFQWLDVQHVDSPFIRRTPQPKAVIAITTDAGLLGGLNALVINKALSRVEDEEGKLIIVGKRGPLYVEKHNLVFANFPGITDEHRLQQALKLRDYVVENFAKGKIGKLEVVFPKPVSFTVQKIEVLELLPFVPNASSRPAEANFSDIVLESGLNETVEYLVYLWLGQKLFEIFGQSRLAEQGARYMHLENCTQRLQDIQKKLKFQYFRARHEIIDQNMRELFSARLLK